MIDFRLSELEELSGGTLVGQDLTVSEVSTDSRPEHVPGLFVALPGAKYDSTIFAADAVAKGAVAVMTPKPLNLNVPQIITEDTLKGFGACGGLVRAKSHAKVLGITGTCGKTSVKEMCARIMGRLGSTIATEGNFNNSVGVPKTLLRLTLATKYAIVEHGASHFHDIDATAVFSRPDVAVINNAGEAHLEGFGSVAGVASGKAEIYHHLKKGGTAVINLESPYASLWRHESEGHDILGFGLSGKADVRAEGISFDDLGCGSFTLITPSGSAKVTLRVPGKHNIMNSLAAAASTFALGATADDIAAGLMEMKPFAGRLSVERHGQVTLIDDAYNASADAVRAAVATLSGFKGDRMLILGDMGELGTEEEEIHRSIGRLVGESGIEHFLTVGRLAALSAEEGRGEAFPDKDALYSRVRDYLRESKEKGLSPVILVKGSHGMKMNEVLDFIRHELEDF